MAVENDKDTKKGFQGRNVKWEILRVMMQKIPSDDNDKLIQSLKKVCGDLGLRVGVRKY